MAFCIHIDKISENEDVHVYHFSTTDFGGHDFYIAIDARKKFITVYTDKELTNPAGYLDASDDNNKPYMFDVDLRMGSFGALKCGMALKRNSFPQSLGHYA